MFKITNKQILADNVKAIDIKADTIVNQARPGQFVIITPDAQSENMAFPITESDRNKSTMTVVVREEGFSSKRLGSVQIGEEILSVRGPLGNPAEIKKYGTVVCIATGMGCASVLPLARALKAAGNKVIGILGAQTKRTLMLEARMRIICDTMLVATNDGSYQRRGKATDIFKETLRDKRIHAVFAAGNIEMMQETSQLTQAKKILTFASLNPLMLDGMGLCGSCRVNINGKIVLACVEGPIFDAHTVDFKHLLLRQNAYKETDKCLSRRSILSPRTNEQKPLAKFVSGILKK
jgi:ferredoxin/flavodoxin---NADP+ reductase